MLAFYGGRERGGGEGRVGVEVWTFLHSWHQMSEWRESCKNRLWRRRDMWEEGYLSYPPSPSMLWY